MRHYVRARELKAAGMDWTDVLAAEDEQPSGTARRRAAGQRCLRQHRRARRGVRRTRGRVPGDVFQLPPQVRKHPPATVCAAITRRLRRRELTSEFSCSICVSVCLSSPLTRQRWQLNRSCCESTRSRPISRVSLRTTLNNIAVIEINAKRLVSARDRLRQAVECQRKALASNPAHPMYRQFMTNHLNNLIRVNRSLGDSEGLAEAERQLVEFRETDPAVVAFVARLRSIVKGEQRPKDVREQLQFAQRAYEIARYGASARFWQERSNWIRASVTIARPSIVTMPHAPPHWLGAAGARTTRFHPTIRKPSFAAKPSPG